LRYRGVAEVVCIVIYTTLCTITPREQKSQINLADDWLWWAIRCQIPVLTIDGKEAGVQPSAYCFPALPMAVQETEHTDWEDQ
jgi:hypothetical protein